MPRAASYINAYIKRGRDAFTAFVFIRLWYKIGRNLGWLTDAENLELQRLFVRVAGNDARVLRYNSSG
jgi:hypothetical protein